MLRKESCMTMNNEEELLDLTQKILIALESDDLVMEQEEKESLEGMNDSMLFFMEQGDFDRAVKEGRQLLKKLEQI